MGYRGGDDRQVQSWLHYVDFITNGSDRTRYPSCPEQLDPRDRFTINRIVAFPFHSNGLIKAAEITRRCEQFLKACLQREAAT